TIRRHPDIPYLKSLKDIEALAILQAGLLDNATALLKPGGTLVYSTCSLELEEGEAQIAALLARNSDVKVDPILPDDVFGQPEWVQPPGFLRTFPYQLDLGTPEWSGMDGFFAARLTRNK
ncbi:MAG TPA: MFS transporter, partial [Methyloceanibacter sp.]